VGCLLLDESCFFLVLVDLFLPVAFELVRNVFVDLFHGLGDVARGASLSLLGWSGESNSWETRADYESVLGHSVEA